MRLARHALAFAFALASVAPLAAEEEAAPAAAAAPAATAETAPPALGPVGHDTQGRPGRVHVVVNGDTLWDISDAYLGTPWVWPSIWRDNTAEVENPHRIYPGERIWISPHEMRKLSETEAAEMLARGEPTPEAPVEEMPAAMADPDGPELTTPPQIYRFTEIQTTGFVTLEELEGAASILSSPSLRTMYTDHLEVQIGLGEGEVVVGDQLDIFRPGELVVDPSTRKKLGRVTEQLGWLEVTAVHEEAATAVIRLSRSDIMKGDHVMPRRQRNPDIAVGARPNVEGVIAYTPGHRLQMGSGDVLYLNRGTRQGLSVGSPVEVYASAGEAYDMVRKEERALPDRVLAKLIVVDAYDDTAVAVVTHTDVELNRGYRFRGSECLSSICPR